VSLEKKKQVIVVFVTTYVQTVSPGIIKIKEIRQVAKPALQGTTKTVKPAAHNAKLADGKTNWVNPAA